MLVDGKVVTMLAATGLRRAGGEIKRATNAGRVLVLVALTAGALSCSGSADGDRTLRAEPTAAPSSAPPTTVAPLAQGPHHCLPAGAEARW